MIGQGHEIAHECGRTKPQPTNRWLLRWAFGFGIAWMITSTAAAATIVVPDDQPTIAAAIGAANPGDEILVRPGRYVESLVVAEGITLRSFAGADLTTIEPPTGEVALDVRSPAGGFRLEGFTIEGADLDDAVGALQVTIASIEIAACRFRGNRGIEGGAAVRVRGGGAVAVTRSSFVNNVSIRGLGGAVYLERGGLCSFQDTAFTENVAPEGGAIYTDRTGLRVDDCRLRGNLALRGGAISASGPTLVQVRGCVLEGNRAHEGNGGALNLDSVTAQVFECLFRANESSALGGAIRSSQGGFTCADTVFLDNVAESEGGAVRIESGTGSVAFATFAGNSSTLPGTAVSYRFGTYSMRNSIVWGNGGPSIAGSGSFPVEYCNLQDPIVAEGNIAEDPLFVEGPAGAFYLSQVASGQGVTSPCVDAGDPATSNGGTTRTDALPDAGIVDMGAHFDARDAILECGGLGEADLLFVNGSRGDGDVPLVTVSAGSPILATLQAPAAGNGRFFVHLNPGVPDETTVTPLPLSLGTACFPVEVPPFGMAAPAAIWSNLANPRAGTSIYFGTPLPAPPRAPTTFLDLPSGDPVNLPPGLDFTIQGAIINPASSAEIGVSLTNAVLVSIR